MSTSTTVGSFLDALRERLVTRPGLTGVSVYTGPVDDVSVGQEAVVFAVTVQSDTYDYPTVPKLEVWESYAVEGRIWIVKAGAGEEAIKAARDRALELLGEVHGQLAEDNADTPTSQDLLGVDDARITSWNLEQFAVDGGRDCRVAFTVAVTARFTP